MKIPPPNSKAGVELYLSDARNSLFALERFAQSYTCFLDDELAVNPLASEAEYERAMEAFWEFHDREKERLVAAISFCEEAVHWAEE